MRNALSALPVLPTSSLRTDHILLLCGQRRPGAGREAGLGLSEWGERRSQRECHSGQWGAAAARPCLTPGGLGRSRALRREDQYPWSSSHLPFREDAGAQDRLCLPAKAPGRTEIAPPSGRLSQHPPKILQFSKHLLWASMARDGSPRAPGPLRALSSRG